MPLIDNAIQECIITQSNIGLGLIIKMEPVMYNEKRIKKSELFQLILLNNLYAQSGSENIIFQGGTALRWVHGGMIFSEDLDFVTDLPEKDMKNILPRHFKKLKCPVSPSSV